MAMSKRFDYEATDISRAYAAARTLTDERARVWGPDICDANFKTAISVRSSI
jgi:hypothetical protein